MVGLHCCLSAVFFQRGCRCCCEVTTWLVTVAWNFEIAGWSRLGAACEQYCCADVGWLYDEDHDRTFGGHPATASKQAVFISSQ